MLRLVAPLLAILALTGCGGAKSDGTSPTSVARRYFAALAAGNGTEACSLLSSAAKENLRHTGKAFGALSCPQQITAAHTLLSPQARSALNNVSLGVPNVSGSKATMSARIGSRSATVRLTKTSAGWVIETFSTTTAP